MSKHEPFTEDQILGFRGLVSAADAAGWNGPFDSPHEHASTGQWLATVDGLRSEVGTERAAREAAEARAKECGEAYGRDTTSLARERNEAIERAEAAEAKAESYRREANAQSARLREAMGRIASDPSVDDWANFYDALADTDEATTAWLARRDERVWEEGYNAGSRVEWVPNPYAKADEDADG